MKLNQIVIFSGQIQCLSGLSIGGSANSIEIGGIDREVIKNPVTKEPYIPGSSLKGKMRSELEKKYGALKWINEISNEEKKTPEYKELEVKKLEVKLEGKKKKILVPSKDEPCGCGKKKCPICVLFGSHKNPGADSAPTRIIVRDATLHKDEEGDKPVDMEIKTENIVLRDSDTAGSPRTIERVPEGTSFNFEIVVRVFEGDNEEELVDKVKEGLALVEKSYLGGLGSRGSGRVRFDYEVACEEI